MMKRIQYAIQKTVPYYLIRFFILVIASITTFLDVLTFPFYLIWQRPWEHWHLIYRDRSIPDSDYPGQLVRKSIKTMPDYFLNYCQTIDGAFEKAYEIYGSQRQCLAWRRILEQEVQMEPPFVRYKLDDYQWMTWKQMMDSIARFGSGLRNLMQIGKGDRVVIFAETSYKWFISAQAIIKNGSILTTLYSALGNQGALEAIKETEAQILLTTRPLLTKLICHPQNSEILSKLKFVVLLDVERNSCQSEEDLNQIRARMKNSNSKDIHLYSYDHLIQSGDEGFYLKNPSKNDPDDLAIIMYTSGSSGQPKGVLITHRNLLEGFKEHVSLIQFFLEEVHRHVYIGYLPLAHILEFGIETMVVLIGARLGYSNPHTLTDMSSGLMPGTKGDASLLKPTVMAAVPLVLDRIRKAILTRLSQQGLFAVKFFEFIVEYKNFWISKGFETPILDCIFMRKFQKLIGGRLEALLIGGAPLASDTQKWIRTCLNVIFVQGYGATETVGAGLFMDEHDYTLAKVGGPLHGTRIKLVDWLEGGYTTTDRPNPRGEIHLTSRSISVGYFKMKHLDKEAYYYDEKGNKWFRTGDVGEMFPNGTFKIIDRKKDFIKLQFGEFVSLGKIETKLKTSYLVNQICVIGDSFKKFLIAIVIPNPKALEQISLRFLDELKTTYNSAGDQSIASSAINEMWYENPKIRKIFSRKMIRHARRNGLEHYEIPQHYLLIKDEWTPENGLVTASFKLKRKQIEHYYRDKIEDFFKILNCNNKNVNYYTK